MRITIIPADNIITVDGDSRRPAEAVNATYPDGVHAIQWYGDHGFIEHIAGRQEHFNNAAAMSIYVEWHALQKQIDQSPAVIDSATAMAALMLNFRRDRKGYTDILSSMAGMYDRAGNNAAAAACDTLIQGLLDIPQQASVITATTPAALKAALEATRTALLIAIPDEYKPALLTAFRKIEP